MLRKERKKEKNGSTASFRIAKLFLNRNILFERDTCLKEIKKKCNYFYFIFQLLLRTSPDEADIDSLNQVQKQIFVYRIYQ